MSHRTLRPHLGTHCLPIQIPVLHFAFPHRYAGGSGPACTIPGGLTSAPEAIPLVPDNHQTRLRDSVQGHLVHLGVEQRCFCLACRNRGPAGEGCDRSDPSSQDEVRVQQPLLHRTQNRWWTTTNPGPMRPEPGPSQAPIQDVDAETHLSMCPSFRLVYSDRPEGCILSCLNSPTTQTVSPFTCI